ncbi:uncharacterized protein LOC131193286 [Ahaetulla prasina]|uniref:uncharacterized protein LOC131193286 n=1 Tax=Ahaetulla prasina TaxID=499056 RepID=UPI0026480731|nr:uncharacterized protein LOC131193286 [Ahaetulla prasina]
MNTNDKLVAEMQTPEPTQKIDPNILDAALKMCLLKNSGPGRNQPSSPPHEGKVRKRKAIAEEFGPHPTSKTFRTTQDSQRETLELFDSEQNKKTGNLVFRQTPKAIGNYLRGWQMDVPKDHPLSIDPRAFLQGVHPQICQKLIEEIQAWRGVKFQLVLKVDLWKDTCSEAMLRHKQKVVLQNSEIDMALDEAFTTIQKMLENWIQRGSGWVIERVQTLWLNIARYQPFQGGSYISQSSVVRNTKAVINVKNKGDHSLRWALRSALFPAEDHVDRPSKYPTQDGLDFKGIQAPTPISHIQRVEKQNNLAINVFGWDKGVIIHWLSCQPRDIPRINLLLIEEAGKFHYAWVKNLDRFLSHQSKHRERKNFCESCLHCYTRKHLLEAHKPYCRGIGQTAVIEVMPKEDNKLFFRNYHKQLPFPYVIYAGTMALTKPIKGSKPNTTKSNIQKTHQQEACGYSYIVVRYDGKTEQPVIKRGQNVAKDFLNCLLKEVDKIKSELAKFHPLLMTRDDQQAHKTATICHVCQKPLYGKIVRDHCHITGKYRGAAHNDCNLKLRQHSKNPVIPVFFHNLRDYDSHFLMQAISEVKEHKITCIPNNTEKYISFSVGPLRFIDSAQFMLASLDKLVSANQSEGFQIMARIEPSRERRELLLRKGVYPYEYMDSWERFTELRLPGKEAFYSKLTEEHVLEADYNHAQEVWSAFGCQTLGDYHDLYLRTNVVLLADVFETFRKTCMQQYDLDPAHYYSIPGLSWDALLKKTGVELELLTDHDQYLFIEKGKRGGISMVSKRYARANNPLVEGYDSSKPTFYIMYLDANNLYGWAMSQPLPTGGFKWEKDLQSLEKNIANHPANSPEGFILEVDLEYPVELHDVHNAYPLAPERMVVQENWMSEYQHNLIGKGMASTQVEKLVPNLRKKERYVLHYRNLQLYLSLGMCLKKIHRALKFKQSPWMEPYIRMNTDLRKKANSDFEKDLYKLMNNSVFGKTMENLRKRVNVKLVRANEEKELRSLIASPAFAQANIFDDNLIAIQVHKSRLLLNQPICVGMSILDLSKYLMYDFYYNEMKVQYRERCQLLYTDTDSLLLEIQTKDVYEDMITKADLYDTSDYPKDHFLHSITNKKVLGKMKDECAGVPIAEYVGLRPKMYSILEAGGPGAKNIKKAQGVKKNVVEKHIRHEHYKKALDSISTFHCCIYVLQSKHHRIYGQYLNKVTLSPYDNKRWIAKNGVDTLAYGYKDAIGLQYQAMSE